MEKKLVDILVVGAGPGGSVAAKTAAEDGYSTLIIEKENLVPDGRYKACGGAIAWELVDLLHYPQEKLSRIVESLELHHYDGTKFSKIGKGATIWRSTFDKYLTDLAVKAGAELWDNCRMITIRKISAENQPQSQLLDNYNYEITTDKKEAVINAKIVIAADGVTSPTLKQLKWPKFPNKDLVLTITHEYRLDPTDIKEILGDDKLYLFFGLELIPLGYAWLFPKAEHVTIGWGNNLALISNAKKEFDKFCKMPLVKEVIKKGKSEIYKPHLIPVNVRARLYNDGVFAVGDAGGLVDPISGKGIPYAMLSGKLAIETLKKAGKKGKLEKLSKLYARALDKEFLIVLKMKRQMRERIFRSDAELKKFLGLWQEHRSSEILMKKLLDE